MGADAVAAEALAERVRDAFDQAAGVDEDDRRAVRAHQRGDAVVHRRLQLVAGDGAELVVGHLDAQLQGAAVASTMAQRGHAVGLATTRADQQAGDAVDRPLRRRQAVRRRSPPTRRSRRSTDSARWAPRPAGDGVDLVEDQRRGLAQQRLPAAVSRM
ncbi:MAG: hypothetical protein U0802_15725 [Candidatus Binatia bacterium]